MSIAEATAPADLERTLRERSGWSGSGPASAR